MSALPNQADVDALRGLLDRMDYFESNDQRARYLLSSDWMRDRDAAPVLTDEVVGIAYAALMSEEFTHPVQAMRAALLATGAFRDEVQS